MKKKMKKFIWEGNIDRLQWKAYGIWAGMIPKEIEGSKRIRMTLEKVV
jgi:hypothetical protein